MSVQGGLGCRGRWACGRVFYFYIFFLGGGRRDDRGKTYMPETRQSKNAAEEDERNKIAFSKTSAEEEEREGGERGRVHPRNGDFCI